MEKGDFITVVSGLPRSGTSLMMQMLSAGGIPPLTDQQRVADESNPRGYFEFDAVKRLRNDQSWLVHARGHAVKIIHLLLRELPTTSGFQYRVVFMRRPLREVLASQRAMLERQGKIAADDSVLTKVFQSQLEQAEHWLAAQPSFSVLSLEHHALFENPQPMIEQLNEFLGSQLDMSAMMAVIDPSLYRQRS
ncbi:MAG: sulfotransferase domain-containing protein [Chthoniobacterales bacterium]